MGEEGEKKGRIVSTKQLSCGEGGVPGTSKRDIELLLGSEIPYVGEGGGKDRGGRGRGSCSITLDNSRSATESSVRGNKEAATSTLSRSNKNGRVLRYT